MSIDPREPNYSGGITLDHEDPSTVYLSRQVGGVFETEVWTTPDEGATWSSRALTSGSARGSYRPISPRGQTGPSHDVVWMHGDYPHFTSYRTGLRTPLLTREIADPAAVSWAPGRLDVFAVDLVTGRLLQRSFQGSWGNWRDRGLGPGGHRLVAPSATSWGNGRIDVVARDEVTDDLLHWWQTGSTWHGPQRLAAGPGGDYAPSIASWGSRRLDIFAATSAGTLAQFYFNGSWHGWSDKGRGPGGRAVLSPAAVAAWGPGRLDVFSQLPGGQLIGHWWYDAGRWRGLQTMGTGPDRIRLAGLGATSWGTRRLDVVATDQETSSLVQLYFDGAWHGPVRQDFNTTTTVMADANPRSTPIPVSAEARAAD
jgi:hypothetical protein